MKFTKIVIHFEVISDGTTSARRAIIERDSAVKAIFLDEQAAREFVRDKKIAAKVRQPDKPHVKVIDENGKEVPRSDTPPGPTLAAGEFPLLDPNNDGPRNWYLVDDGVECW